MVGFGERNLKKGLNWHDNPAMDYYDMDDTMVPERDASNAGYQAGDELVGGHDMDTQGGGMQLKTSISAFNQQRTVVAKLSR